MKTCSVCALPKDPREFNRRSLRPDGLRTDCRSCQSSYNASRYSKSAETIKDKVRQYRVSHVDSVAATRAEHYAKNRERVLARCRDYFAKNKDARNAYRRQYARENPAQEERWRANRTVDKAARCASTAKRLAAKLQATPAWADLAAIARLYEDAKAASELFGLPFHVDHVVPLRSPVVCGLHCEANLEVLPAFANTSKSNRYWPDMPT